MNYENLKHHASDCQIAADEMASKLIDQSNIVKKLAVVQGICDFNIFWLYQISTLVLMESTVDFMYLNVREFKRKLTIREMIRFDGIITHNEIKDFEDFKQILKR